MTKQAQLPDGTILEFPDETPDDVMDRAVKSHLAGRQPPAKPAANNSQFAQLIKGKPAQRQPATYNFTGVPGVSTQIGGALDAFQHHVMNIPHGVAQLVSHGLGLDSAEQDDAALRQREADYQARTAGNASSYAGAAAGEVLPWMVGIGGLKSAGLLPKLAATRDVVGLGAKAGNIAAKGGLLAAEGGLMGLVSPVTGEGSYGEQKGAQVATGAIAAPLIAAGVRGVQAGAGGVRQAARYATEGGREQLANQRLAKLLGTDPGTLAALRQNTSVPGYNLTPAQALATPEAVQAERVLRNNGLTAPAFAEAESANNAALRGEAARLAGTDADMAAAVEARRSGPGQFWRGNLVLGAEDGRFGSAGKHLADFLQSRPLNMTEFKVLDEARKITGQVQRGTIDALEGERRLAALEPKTRAGKKALEQATGILNQGMVNPGRIVGELEKLSRSGNKAVSSAAADHLATIAKNQDATGWVHARVLDDVRQNIGTMLGQHSPHGAVGSQEGALYGPLKAKIANTIDRALPGYRDSLAAYARLSQPINDMEAGRTLLGAIDSGGRDAGGNQAVTLNHLKSLLSQNGRADYPMSPQAEARVRAMLEALQKRSVTNNTVAASGPGTAADTLRGGIALPVVQRGISGLAATLGTVLGNAPGGLAALLASEGMIAANNSVTRKLGQKAASAKLSAEAIEAYQRQLSQQQALQQYGMPQYLLPFVSK